MEGSWASTPTQRAGGAPFCLDLSFEHQFNSSSRTLNETISKWVLLMWGVETLWGAIIIDKTTKLKIRMPMWLSMQFAWHATITKWDSVIKEKFYDSCTFDYTHLVTHLHSSTFVLHSSTWLIYTRLVFVRLHLSTLG